MNLLRFGLNRDPDKYVESRRVLKVLGCVLGHFSLSGLRQTEAQEDPSKASLPPLAATQRFQLQLLRTSKTPPWLSCQCEASRSQRDWQVMLCCQTWLIDRHLA